jgi:hypothetical protein
MREAWNHSADERDRWCARENRKLSFHEKIKQMEDLTRITRSMHAIYIRCFYANATQQQVVDHWLRMTLEPALYVEVRLRRLQLDFDVLPLPLPADVRIDALIRSLLTLERRQVFCEQYYELESSTAAV